jgi:Flp pilus assembly pilin Flp
VSRWAPAGSCGFGQWGGVTVKDALVEFVRDESAQDLVEYALLGVFIGVVSIVVWQNIASLIGDRYAEYNTNVNSLWASPEFGS